MAQVPVSIGGLSLTTGAASAPRRAERVELLAPAGSYEALIAAVENGADAVYLAGQHFGARKFAQNFTDDELRSAVDYAHVRGVKVFVTVNTLVKEDEFPSLVRFLHLLNEAGVDAIIVQDLGVVRLARDTVPDLPVHISTQATVHNSAGVRWLESLGAERVILAREMDLREIRQMKEKTGAELESFVHGALCYCYSGQCLASSLIGGRSGNRGACAYTCRLPYDLVAGGERAAAGAGMPMKAEPERKELRQKHVLSAKDLETLDAIPEMIEAGLSSFKIEGRMKRPEYVATAVEVYRKAIDRHYAGKFYVTDDERSRLLSVFNRDFTGGFHKDGAGKWAFANYDSAGNRGTVLGRVVKSGKGWVQVKLEHELRAGDGIEILHTPEGWDQEQGSDASAPAFPASKGPRPSAADRAAARVERKGVGKLDDHGPEEWGFTVREMLVQRRTHRVGEAPVHTALGRPGEVVELKGHQYARAGDPVYKTADVEVLEAARKTYEGGNHRKMPVVVDVAVAVGRPLVVKLTAADGRVTVEHDPGFVVPEARSAPLSDAAVREQMQKFGDTPFAPQTVKVRVDRKAFVPLGVLNDARRGAAAALERALAVRSHRPPAGEVAKARELLARPTAPRTVRKPTLVVKAWGPANLEAALEAGATEVYFSGLRVGGLQPRWDLDAVAKGLDAAQSKGAKLWIDSGPVQHDWEVDMLAKAVERAKAHPAFAGVVAGHHGAMQVATEAAVPFVADWSLNAFNALTLDFLAAKGAARVVLSPELTLEEAKRIGAGTSVPVEVLAHGRHQLMVSEYCTIGHATDCQKTTRAPCHERPYAITDRKGYRFPLATDGACRMYMLNSVELNMIDRIPDLAEAGVDVVRIETIATAPDATAVQVRTYLEALAAWDTAGALREKWTFEPRWWDDLAAVNPDGFTTGHFYRGPL